jgi:hypothetical protein
MKTSYATVAGIVGFIACGWSCNQLADIHEGILVECTGVEDCTPEVPECQTAVDCDDEGKCIFTNAEDWKQLVEQTPGDCAEAFCDGAGRARLVQDPTDTKDDDNVCTLDTCDGMTPAHKAKPDFECYTGPPSTKGVGICRAGTQKCNKQGNPVGGCEGEVLPATETCAALGDEDCDGEANEENCDCVPAAEVDCYTGPMDSYNVGACQEGTQICQSDGLGYGKCNGEQTPAIEACEGWIDEDCDGRIDEEDEDCG